MGVFDNCSDKEFHPLTEEYCIKDGWLDLSADTFLDPGYIKFIKVKIIIPCVSLGDIVDTATFKIGYVLEDSSIHINIFSHENIFSEQPKFGHWYFDPIIIQNPTLEDLNIVTTSEYLSSRITQI